MISKDKMYIIADNIDDSIKLQTASYDITIFKNIMEFEKWVNAVPVVVDTIIVTTDVLPFTGTNTQRLIRALKSPFLKLTGNLIYLADRGYDKERIREFVESQNLNWVFYFDDLTPKYIVSVVNGEGRRSDEVQSEVVTYRIRASEYVKQQNIKKMSEGLDNHYMSDEELLSGIPDEEEPEEINPTVDVSTEIRYIVGQDYISRTLIVFLVAQYLALSSKTLIMEKDVEYHTLTELATKSDVEFCYVDVTELIGNFQEALAKIKSSGNNLIVIGSKKRVQYSYEFLFDILHSNLKGVVDYMVRECNFNETVYGRRFTMVMNNNIPDALKTCSLVSNAINEKDVNIIGLQVGSFGPVDLSSRELKEILSVVLGKNDLQVQIMKASGISLKGEDKVYDILSFIK